jgi:signal peptide peptidase SppA
MKSNLTNIMQAVYAEPWLILPAQHAVIRRIVESHITGGAHLPDGCATMYEDKPDEERPTYTMFENVAIVPIIGTLGMRVGSLEKCSGMCDFLDVQLALEDAQNDPHTEAIVLAIDSPGGMVTGTPETAAAVAGYAERYPVVAHTDSLMASAAYWIAAPSAMILATESAQVGSIGVYSAFLDQSRAYEMEGFKTELFKTGEFKGMGMPGLPLTDKQREHMQAAVDAIFEDFQAVVNEHRYVKPDAMQGQTFRGSEAITAGLIDEAGDLGRAVEVAQELIEKRKKEGK